MEILKNDSIQEAIEKSLDGSMSYNEYLSLTTDLISKNQSTGNDPDSEYLLGYTVLNERRMRRWNKTLKLSSEVLEQIKSAPNKKVTWVILTESWCGDAAHALPAMQKVAEASNNITVKIALRDENPKLMDAFLTNGNRSIPKLIAYDEDHKTVIGTWGPRPSEATKMVNDYKSQYGSLDDDFKEKLQVWYNKDKGKDIMKDLLALLQSDSSI